MGTTRPADPDSSLPQTTPVAGARSLRFVVNPLVSYLRAHRQSALDFAVDKFKRHRVTAIGEQHAPGFSAIGDENGCVRMFLRDLCLALHADSDCRFRYLALELDENAVRQRVGGWETMVLPPGVVNRKAHWLAEAGFRPALSEIFRAIAQRIPDTELTVVGIDHRVGELSYDRAGAFTRGLDGGDVQRAPNESQAEFERRRDQSIEDRQREYNQLSLERDREAANNFERQILANLGSARALIYYGATHLREGRVEPGRHYYTGITNNTFIRQLINRDNGLSADDVCSLVSVYPGSGRRERSISTRELRREVADEVQLVRIFDLLRAEFPDDDNIGFDVDDSRFAILPIDRSNAYPIGERFDGCLYFRDLNNWDGQTQPPEGARSQPAQVPELSVTSVIPMRASPGNTIFIYGFVLSADTEVTVVTRGPEGPGARFACTDVVCINENVIRARVPRPGATPVGGQEATIQLSRRGAPSSGEAVELLGAFRYVIM
ncbi:hypothetical protein ENSA5_05230 [Enhygromyxa salina]|uniref:IPT/TIG domain-containing protein n=1 Tax=Enhygromyxa salina TaxID=215803 RepID=A0A2S9YI22_9BACT|nr:hypothetical protein [Enhygromyxa salina]PRQ04758.1 hypothetical protein ENSA5_05230 [Enhygromyxa salina]